MPDLMAGDAPFVPRRGRVVPAILAVASVVVFTIVAFVVPERFQLVDRVAFVGLGVAVALVLSRYVTIRAAAHEDGLFVRNLGPAQTIPWQQIEGVRFAEGMPWVRLDLEDGDDVAVMAIQRADGPGSVAEAQRLSDLVARHRRR